MKPSTLLAATTVLLLTPALAAAQAETRPGPLVFSGGATFEVPYPDFETPIDIDYRVAFEVAGAAAEPSEMNRSFNSVARFLNMHAAAGVPAERIQLAVVVHGPSAWELLDDGAYRQRHGVDNPNSQLIRDLMDQGVQFVLCGQTAASRGVPRDDLMDGIQVALSAMTAFVVLQADGYQVNPW